MVKSKRTIDDVDTYESDGGFVSNDDGKVKLKERKGGKRAKTTDASKFWSLSSGRNPRRVEISDFKGQKLVNLREFYEKDDAYLPGKKGISLSIDQYKELLKAIPEINARLKDAGFDVSAIAADDDDDDDDEEEEEEEEEGVSETKAKPHRKVKAKKSKANIEATSDEEDEE